MNEFIEKLIGRLEESKKVLEEAAVKEMGINGHTLDFENYNGAIGAVKCAITLVKHLAEEYKEQNSDQDLMVVESLPSLYPMMQPFEVEAIHRVVERTKYSDDWITCSTDMPDHDEEVFIKFSDGAICNGKFWIAEGTNYCGFNTKFGLFVAEQVAEWKPIAPYQPKGE